MPFCGNEGETMNHLLLHCKYSWRDWFESMKWWSIQMPISKTPAEWFERWVETVKGDFQKKLRIFLFFVVTWSIWNQRNRVVFERETLIGNIFSI